jgi:anaerobic magnesium-protoporphyrin IX monomethyl ester cyclase
MSVAASATGNTPRVLLVGYEDRENLGLRYLLAAVRRAGFDGEIIRMTRADPELVERIVSRRPTLVGLSLIFQYMAPQFGTLVSALRRARLECHITMGGHFPSFDYEQILGRMPELDSVVRFEGEATLVELVQRLEQGADWRDIPGIAYREGNSVVATALRAPEQDLDRLPLPARDGYDYAAEQPPTAAILGSRGCPWRCSFCSIRPFYQAQGGRLRRLRRPGAVVDEMQALYDENGVRVFLFQDDDFLAGGRKAAAWARALADEIRASPLGGRIVFKINSRSDGIDTELLTHLRDAGLTHVYMGVEAGDADDLADLGKRMTPEVHFEAGRVLRALGLSFDFGFMLLQPYSTLARVRNNLDFLDRFVGDGWSAASFCRMLPYAGTQMRDRLSAQGRLAGTSFEPDYRFLDPKLDVFYDWMVYAFHERNFSSTGLSYALRALNFEARLQLRDNPFTPTERRFVQHLCAVSNRVATDTLRTALDWIDTTALGELEADRGALGMLADHQHRQDERIQQELGTLYAAVLQRKRRGLVRLPAARPLELV